MRSYVALLRGVNLGSHNRLNMPQLVAAFETLGYKNVESYVQSGNMVFTAITAPTKLADQISGMIKQQFGHELTVIVKTAEEIRLIAGQNPFLAGPGLDETKLHVTFLARLPEAEKLLEISPDLGGDDRWAAINDCVYLYCPGGYGRSKLTNSLFETKLKVPATTRNWKTVLALAKLVNK